MAEKTGNVLLEESMLPVFLHGYEDMKTAFCDFLYIKREKISEC